MAQKFVDVEALNLRSSPIVDPSTRIGILDLGQPVEELGPDAEPGWVKIKADVDGVAKNGVVKREINGEPSLRAPVSASREALVAEAIKEWLRFERGLGQEHRDPFFKFVGEMWKKIGRNLDGKDRGVPWSAAAISFMVRHAGEKFPLYKKFEFAGAHRFYFHDSIVKRRKGDTNAPFWGFQLHEKRPEIGDIVGGWRETPSDFDDAERFDPKKDIPPFPSHSDIIVSVKADFVLAIGGNVRQSVNINRYEKTAAGFLAPTVTHNSAGKPTSGVIIHMANQT